MSRWILHEQGSILHLIPTATGRSDVFYIHETAKKLLGLIPINKEKTEQAIGVSDEICERLVRLHYAEANQEILDLLASLKEAQN